uniref:Uncharacterized protein n=1 Tax=Oryza meridionalis TaxID=40149 RepID=A0A0E0CPY4_9ORYZ
MVGPTWAPHVILNPLWLLLLFFLLPFFAARLLMERGSEAVRGVGASDGGGVLTGLRELAGGCVVHGVPADGVAEVRAGDGPAGDRD